VGTYGVWFATGSQRNVLIRSELRDLGGGGVKIGETQTPRNKATACRENVVENCFIHDGGRIARAGIGAWIGRSSFNTLRHNDICDFDYSAVSIGWCWGYASSSANHNIVEYNHLHHIGSGVLSDMGGVYCLGISPGTVLRGNVIHDVYAYSYGGWGLYTDEGSSEILMEHNIVYNTKSGGFHQHYGRENIVRSNILAFSREGQIIRSREEEHLSFTVENNILIFDNGQPLGGNWSNGNFLLKSNLYWDVTAQPFTFAGYTLEEWQEEEGQDVGSVIRPPLFRDAKAYDFRAAKHSSVKDYGIDPDAILAKAGLYGPRKWRDKPGRVTHRAIDPEMKPPRDAKRPSLTRAIEEDFEGLKVGDKVGFANTSGEDKGASIRVTDELAAAGKHSLKFTDAEGLDYNWQPHLSARMMWRKGIVRASFDVFLKPGAVFWHEWRDRASPYRIGPSLRFEADGQLRVSTRDAEGKRAKQALTGFPLGQWVHVEIVCPLGKDGAGTYELAISAPDKPRETFEVVTGSEDWQLCACMVFVSEATQKTEFYLDNLSFRRSAK